MEKLNQYIIRQSELKNIMSESDKYAAKCYKLGLSFAETYPEMYNAYISANEEYNNNEILMKPLLEAERAERKKRVELIKATIKAEREKKQQNK